MVAPRARSGAQRAQSNARFYSALVLLLVVGVGAIVYFATHKSAAPAVTTVDPTQPLGPAKGHLLGKPDAPVQVLEFADFECPACGTFAIVTEPDVRKRLIDSGRVSYRFYDFPLPMHKNTWFASNAAACAEDQGKFWEMHDMLFQGQSDWNGEATSNPSKILKGYAQQLGLDVDKWQTCYEHQDHLRDIQANKAEGERRQVNQTPTFVIGSKQIPGALGFDQFRAYVDSANAPRKVAAAK